MIPQLKRLRAANVLRLATSEYYADKRDAGPEWWALCMAGEAGETCDAVKKMLTRHKRSGRTPEDIGSEIADVIVYLDLLADSLGLDMWDCVVSKFNEVSDRVGSPVKL
jgi:NTP pyrophosphatase (non-canonical NTP hydrolase)